MFSPCESTNFCTSSSVVVSSSQMSMPTNVALLSYFLASPLSTGMAALHGPHQVAQNSTTYVLPGSKFLTGVPFSHFADSIDGAVSPHFKVGCVLGAAGA